METEHRKMKCELYQDSMQNWKDIEGYEGLYKVSTNGDIWSCRKNRLKIPSKQNGGYMLVFLVKDGKRKAYLTHRLVAQTYIENPYNLAEVNHIDGNKKNNNVENLEWCSRSDNLKHRARVLGQRGNARAVICVDKGIEFDAIKDAATWAGVTSGAIQQSIRNPNRRAGGYKWIRK